MSYHIIDLAWTLNSIDPDHQVFNASDELCFNIRLQNTIIVVVYGFKLQTTYCTVVNFKQSGTHLGCEYGAQKNVLKSRGMEKNVREKSGNFNSENG